MHGGDGEVTGGELIREPVNLSPGVTENDGLGNSDGLVEVRKCVEFPIFLLDGNIELLDALEGKFSFLDQDADRIAHEFGRDFEHILGHGGRKKNDLG